MTRECKIGKYHFQAQNFPKSTISKSKIFGEI